MAFLFPVLYILGGVGTFFAWKAYVTYKWKTEWTLLREDEVFDSGFYALGVTGIILWPVVLPVILMFWAVDSST